VENASGPPVPTQWPVQWEPSPADPTKPRGKYLTFPEFLADIPVSEIKTPPRPIVFGLLDPTQGPGSQPQFTINGKQFQDGTVDQCMVLDTAEEWIISNQTGVPHPFHIHVNPFQVIEYFDPSLQNQPTPMPAPYVWQDTIEIPAQAMGPDGVTRDGHVRMRSRFCDFTGTYVLHCHILGHEDRGMMEIVEVRANACPVTPHMTMLTHGH
jgi:FtsP/CotA-like multicopper oxidase with cupredoxin domain